MRRSSVQKMSLERASCRCEKRRRLMHGMHLATLLVSHIDELDNDSILITAQVNMFN